MKESYTILWFDDECDELDYINRSAIEKKIILKGFTNAKEGLSELHSNPEKYDAILVDGYFLKEQGQITSEQNASAFISVARELDKISKLWFILSGNPDFTQPKGSRVSEIIEGFENKKVYDKELENLPSLWTDIISAIDNIPDNRIRRKYADVFEAFLELNLNEFLTNDDESHLIGILKSIDERKDFKDDLYFPVLRRILEALFRKANKLGILHDACISVQGKVNLTESSLFLAGEETKHLKVKSQKKHFPKIIASQVKDILFTTGGNAHTVDTALERNDELMQYRKILRTPNLLFSLTFQLLDIIIWFNEYLKINSDIESNKSFWQSIEQIQWLKGKVIRIAENGFGTFKSSKGVEVTIHKKDVEQYKLRLFQEIELLPKYENSKTLTDKIKV